MRPDSSSDVVLSDDDLLHSLNLPYVYHEFLPPRSKCTAIQLPKQNSFIGNQLEAADCFPEAWALPMSCNSLPIPYLVSELPSTELSSVSDLVFSCDASMEPAKTPFAHMAQRSFFASDQPISMCPPEQLSTDGSNFSGRTDSNTSCHSFAPRFWGMCEDPRPGVPSLNFSGSASSSYCETTDGNYTSNSDWDFIKGFLRTEEMSGQDSSTDEQQETAGARAPPLEAVAATTLQPSPSYAGVVAPSTPPNMPGLRGDVCPVQAGPAFALGNPVPPACAASLSDCAEQLGTPSSEVAQSLRRHSSSLSINNAGHFPHAPHNASPPVTKAASSQDNKSAAQSTAKRCNAADDVAPACAARAQKQPSRKRARAAPEVKAARRSMTQHQNHVRRKAREKEVHDKAAELQTKVAALEKDIADLTARNAGLSRLSAGPPAADDTTGLPMCHASNGVVQQSVADDGERHSRLLTQLDAEEARALLVARDSSGMEASALTDIQMNTILGMYAEYCEGIRSLTVEHFGLLKKLSQGSMPLEFATSEDQIRGHMAMTEAVRRLRANQRSGEVLKKQLTFGCVQVLSPAQLHGCTNGAQTGLDALSLCCSLAGAMSN